MISPMSICFTGHKTINNTYYNPLDESPLWYSLRNYLMTYVMRAYEKGWYDFMVGGALGVDMIAGLAVCELMDTGYYPHLRLHLAIPHPNYNNKWFKECDKQDLERIKNHAIPYVLDTSPVFTIPMLFSRNHFMVDQTAITTAVWDGRQKGGTFECYTYAQRQQKQRCIINPHTLKEVWNDKEETHVN